MNREYRRVNRMFHLDPPNTDSRGWYFEIRDGLPRGPYRSLALAGMALEAYLSRLENTQHSDRSRAVSVHGENTECWEAITT